jgi:NAD+ synthase (glutamine-hydrolysing)
VGTLRLALCQIDVVVGDMENNVAAVLDALSKAEAQEADVAVFPELALCGYPPEDLLHSPAFVQENMSALHDLEGQTKGCAAIVGFVESNGALHNAAAVLANGKCHGIWRKELLPNYGVFDEQRWFVPGNGETPLFSFRGIRVGVAICEDVWSTSGPVLRQAKDGAQIVVILNASPYRLGVGAEREQMLKERAIDAGCALGYVNLVGGQDELVFDGNSMIIDRFGTLVASAPQFEEALLVVDLDADDHMSKASKPGQLSPAALPHGVVEVLPEKSHALSTQLRGTVHERLDADAEVYAALVCATRDYVEKNGFRDVVIGLSGGVDSALVGSIAHDALGSDHVHGVTMPSRFSSQASVDDARALSHNLDIDFRVMPIEPAHKALLEILAPSFVGREADLTEENLQARVRGVLLMALSNKFGWLVLTTGNKSETAVGFSTIYGDTAGGFAVIRDVSKTLVYRLCAMRNAQAGREWIPQAILDKAPSAELRLDQRDDDTLPAYDILDPILEGYVERDLSVAELVAAGNDEATVRKVIDLVDHAEYKRRQAPPGARVTSRGFGKDRRMPITNSFRASRRPVGPTDAR